MMNVDSACEKLDDAAMERIQATRGHASDVYDRSAEKLRPLSLSERRQYLKDLRGVLIRKYKDPSDPQFHENFMPRFVRAMEKRGIFFDEAAQR